MGFGDMIFIACMVGGFIFFLAKAAKVDLGEALEEVKKTMLGFGNKSKGVAKDIFGKQSININAENVYMQIQDGNVSRISSDSGEIYLDNKPVGERGFMHTLLGSGNSPELKRHIDPREVHYDITFKRFNKLLENECKEVRDYFEELVHIVDGTSEVGSLLQYHQGSEVEHPALRSMQTSIKELLSADRGEKSFSAIVEVLTKNNVLAEVPSKISESTDSILQLLSTIVSESEARVVSDESDVRAIKRCVKINYSVYLSPKNSMQNRFIEALCRSYGIRDGVEDLQKRSEDIISKFFRQKYDILSLEISADNIGIEELPTTVDVKVVQPDTPPFLGSLAVYENEASRSEIVNNSSQYAVNEQVNAVINSVFVPFTRIAIFKSILGVTTIPDSK